MTHKDPRPDLTADSEAWVDMMVQAEKYSHQLVSNLIEMRKWGTRIRHGKSGYIMVPEMGGKNWPSMEAYQEYRDRLLGPYREQIMEILAYLLVEFVKLGKPPREECANSAHCRWLEDCDMYPFIEQGVWLCRERIKNNVEAIIWPEITPCRRPAPNA